ncbi:tetratricopeptide repeat protein [Marinobacterium aestuariivivens]|uniref:Tetratricopeptide repeat protein n=1 Tax=Marinobacterium aestuariivivens TaxID=1698799 RepID=A0ABW1ZW19_9GAMM
MAAASSANMAVSYLQEQSFDFCFVAYDLGPRAKTGLQVIQEATLDGARRFQDTFVLVAEPEQAEVLAGALEYAPDSCLSKPYDPVRLRQCLDRLARVKQLLLPLEALLDREQWAEALGCFEHFQGLYPGVRPYFLRLKGLVLLRLQRYEEALALFAGVLQERDVDWAHIGQGVALFRLGRYREAQECLLRLTGQHHTAVEAFILLTLVHRVLGDPGAAQMLLRKAVILQPSMPQLQSDLANLMALEGDWAQAVTAWREALNYARHSPFQRADDYYGLVQALLQQIDERQSPASVAAEAEAVRTLEAAVRDFMGEPVVLFRARLMGAQIYQRSGNRSMAEQAARDAFERYAALPLSDQAELVDPLVDALEFSSLAQASLERRQEVMRRLATLDWGRANLAGMVSYRKGHYEQAFDRFREAEALRGGSPGVVLNLVQSGLRVAVSTPARRAEILRQCSDLLFDVRFGVLSHRQQERYRALCRRLGELNRSQGGSG